jgi:hypothetical protein
VKEVYLTNGRGVALVDDEDYELVRHYSWRLSSRGYAVAWTPGSAEERRLVYMHRLLTGVPDDLDVDHENRNKLDNRRFNLRWATTSQNIANRAKAEGCSSQYIGVSWDEGRQRWRAMVKKDGVAYNLGRFTDEEAAARARDRRALELFGKFAVLNFPELRRAA